MTSLGGGGRGCVVLFGRRALWLGIDLMLTRCVGDHDGLRKSGAPYAIKNVF